MIFDLFFVVEVRIFMTIPPLPSLLGNLYFIPISNDGY